MARETSAQRNARNEAKINAQLAQEEREYPKRLMVALERATNKFNFELTVVQQQFHLVHRATFEDFTINPTWSREVYELYELEDEMENLDQRRQEESRKEAVRTAALNKLTREERELLNLM